MKKTLLIRGWSLVSVGLVVLGGDLPCLLSYGCDATDVAEVSDGFLIDWPTGEKPPWALVPAYTYSFGFWLLALATFVIQRRIGKRYSGHMWRGAE